MFECQMVGCSTLVDRQQRTHGHRWLNGVEGTTRSADYTEHRRRRAVLATGTASSVKYRGTAPVRQRCKNAHSTSSKDVTAYERRLCRNKVTMLVIFKKLILCPTWCQINQSINHQFISSLAEPTVSWHWMIMVSQPGQGPSLQAQRTENVKQKCNKK